METSNPNIPNSTSADVNQYFNHNSYANSLPSPRSYHHQRHPDERLCNLLPDPQRGPLGYLSEPRRERSHSLLSQSAYDINSYCAAQPFYAPYQADHKTPTVAIGNNESKSQIYSQLVAEAQDHIHAKIMFTQQRIQDQQLQQQQFQQLHRLHTQELKQAKQKKFDARLQHSDMPKYQLQQQAPRSSLEGSVYQVRSPPSMAKCNLSFFCVNISPYCPLFLITIDYLVICIGSVQTQSSLYDTRRFYCYWCRAWIFRNCRG